MENVKLELEKKIKEMKTELEEANEKCFRLDSITSMLQQSRKRNEQFRDELNQKEAEVEELRQFLNQSPSRKRTYRFFYKNFFIIFMFLAILLLHLNK